jgi:hypothetical protein
MKTNYVIMSCCFFLSTIASNAQSLELSTLLNISSQERLDKANGISVMYSHDVSKNGALGLAICYKQNHSIYERINTDSYITDENPDGSPEYIFGWIDSHYKGCSFRLNYQYALINRNDVEVSIGPEISYNLFWGNGSSHYIHSENPDSILSHAGKNPLSYKIGCGLLASVQVHHVFVDKLSLCVNLRPEMLFNPHYEADAVNSISNFDIQIGFQYRFN